MRKIGYGLFCGAFAALLALVMVGALVAADCNHWYDQRLCGQGALEYEGAVLFDYEVFESPISIADSPGHFMVARLKADADQIAFYMNRQSEPTSIGYPHEATGCYTDWSGNDGDRATWFCYDGEDTINLWYGTLRWRGHGNELEGPWLYRMSIVTVSSETGKELRRFIPPRRGGERRGAARVRP
jgi:hypothetical protein